MLKRRLIWLLTAGVVLIGVLVSSALREREPEYGGKKLSGWVDLVGLTGFTGEQAAQDPFGHMGTNALPYLLDWLRYEPPTWKRKLYKTVNTILGPDRDPGRWRPRDKQLLRQFGASVALELLGAQAEGAVPELCQIMNDPKSHFSAWEVASALPYLGKQGIRSAVWGLTNHEHWVQYSLSHHLEWLGTNARPAVPGLLGLLQHSDPITRKFATDALRKIDPEAPEKAAP